MATSTPHHGVPVLEENITNMFPWTYNLYHYASILPYGKEILSGVDTEIPDSPTMTVSLLAGSLRTIITSPLHAMQQIRDRAYKRSTDDALKTAIIATASSVDETMRLNLESAPSSSAMMWYIFDRYHCSSVVQRDRIYAYTSYHAINVTMFTSYQEFADAFMYRLDNMTFHGFPCIWSDEEVVLRFATAIGPRNPRYADDIYQRLANKRPIAIPELIQEVIQMDGCPMGH